MVSLLQATQVAFSHTHRLSVPHMTRGWTILSAQLAPASLMRAPTRDIASSKASQQRGSSLTSLSGDPWYHYSSPPK